MEAFGRIQVRTICISCPSELPEAYKAAVDHFTQREVNAQFIHGIHAETFGILAWRPYRKNKPKLGELVEMAQVGLSLSHYMAWQVCEFLDDDLFMILEDDAEFPDDWASQVLDALADVPDDFDILLIGSSNTADKEKTQIKGRIFEVKYPFCTHAYIVTKAAIPSLLELVKDASMHIDIALIEKAYPKLRVYTVLPRIVSQRGRDLAE